ncbi:acetolactate synthase large subunit [Falsochrobactrum sp. TDYN1]|uniref:Acetolactate synthase large subunit n=1 Tax=Falsochrobactrum tianjinense TaxID=2706015 RepID=A0A949PLN4_9HYPH|nr:acetolactate synthase large subunit [Falsochrobactrum sp. TDYN1]MBV2143556.1 acetolactate synthase large subunit [Falsochrobactrum sp. TDYN1]
MNGADVLCQTLLDHEIEVCFANPGTSEMHFVAALDAQPQMRCVLGLFEGVVTGAADGYARMTERPASTLLHTGPGLANGLANLHNARRAHSPMVNIVGDHATDHLPYDAPLTTDIESLARPMSHWVGRVGGTTSIQADVKSAIVAAQSHGGQVATLILPADAAWGKAEYAHSSLAEVPELLATDDKAIGNAATAIRRAGSNCLILLGGAALRPEPMAEAARIANTFGATIMAEQANARITHGLGSAAPTRIPYAVDTAVAQLAAFDTIVLIGAKSPVAFFKFPGKPHRVIRPDCKVITLAGPETDPYTTLSALREGLGLDSHAALRVVDAPRPEIAHGALTAQAVVQTIAALLPENAILCDEAISHSHALGLAARGAAPHDLLQLTGGAIGIGPSLSVGAAIACPDRRVINVQADGSAMYTVQALWTQAREGLDITTVILSNRSYACLYGELTNLGRPEPGRNAQRMLDLDDPSLDWTALAKGLGVPGIRVTSTAALARELAQAIATPGPSLIEVALSDTT